VPPSAADACPRAADYIPAAYAAFLARARRLADSGVNTATSVAVHDMLVHSHQDVAWARHVLVVELAGASYPFAAPAGSASA
jgi:hypothetical protein